MSNQNADQPAYPASAQGLQDGKIIVMQEGLTKRELIAAMAMQGLLVNENAPHKARLLLVELAIEYSDELLKTLSNGK